MDLMTNKTNDVRQYFIESLEEVEHRLDNDITIENDLIDKFEETKSLFNQLEDVAPCYGYDSELSKRIDDIDATLTH